MKKTFFLFLLFTKCLFCNATVHIKQTLQKENVLIALYGNDLKYDAKGMITKSIAGKQYKIEVDTIFDYTHSKTTNTEALAIILLHEFDKDGFLTCHGCYPKITLALFYLKNNKWELENKIQDFSGASGTWGNTPSITFLDDGDSHYLTIGSTWTEEGNTKEMNDEYDLDNLFNNKNTKSFIKTEGHNASSSSVTNNAKPTAIPTKTIKNPPVPSSVPFPSAAAREFARWAAYNFEFGTDYYKGFIYAIFRRRGMEMPEIAVAMENLNKSKENVEFILQSIYNQCRDRNLIFANINGLGVTATNSKTLTDYLMNKYGL